MSTIALHLVPTAAAAQAGYMSLTGMILGTHRPESNNHTPQEMSVAANQWLQSLSLTQLQLAQLSLDNPERRSWTNSPARGEPGGIALSELDKVQLQNLFDLLSTLVSDTGYEKLRAVMLGDDLRSVIGGKANSGVGIGAFSGNGIW